MITINDNKFSIENSYIKRELQFEPGFGLKTTSFYNKKSNTEYAKEVAGCEFLIKLNGQDIFGYDTNTTSNLDVCTGKDMLTLELVSVEQNRNGANECLSITMKIPQIGVLVSCNYEISPNMSGLVKWMNIQAGDRELKIEKFSFEIYNAYPGELPDIFFYSTKDCGPKPKFFISHIEEDIIQAHNSLSHEGLAAHLFLLLPSKALK